MSSRWALGRGSRGGKQRKHVFKRWKAEKNEWNTEKVLNRQGGIWRNLEDPAEKGEMLRSKSFID
jgi:hypothetical protein